MLLMGYVMIILLYFIGILLISYSLLFMVINLNLFNMGYNLIEYVKFINRESILLIIGILLIIIFFIIKGANKNDIHL